MDPNLKHRLSSVANPNADYYRPDETRLAKDALAEIDRLERERDGAIDRLLPLGLEVERLREALVDASHIGPLGIDTYPECYRQMQAIIGVALRSPEDK